MADPWRFHSRTRSLIEGLKLLDGPPHLGAEIGVQFGKNAFSLLSFYSELVLRLVDSYEDCLFGHRTKTAAQARGAAHQKLAGFGSRAIWMEMRSVEAAKLVGDKTLDYAFIDACHDYEYVRDDIAAWLPKIRAGGVLAGHDYVRYSGVRRAVRERFGRGIPKIGDTWWSIIP